MNNLHSYPKAGELVIIKEGKVQIKEFTDLT